MSTFRLGIIQNQGWIWGARWRKPAEFCTYVSQWKLYRTQIFHSGCTFCRLFNLLCVRLDAHLKILNGSLARELHEVELDLENVMVVCEIKRFSYNSELPWMCCFQMHGRTRNKHVLMLTLEFENMNSIYVWLVTFLCFKRC